MLAVKKQKMLHKHSALHYIISGKGMQDVSDKILKKVSGGEYLMLCSIEELREKDIINVYNGENLGYVDDVQIETENRTVKALILYGKPRFFGLFGMRERVTIPFQQVQLIGKDVILVAISHENCADILNIKRN